MVMNCILKLKLWFTGSKFTILSHLSKKKSVNFHDVPPPPLYSQIESPWGSYTGSYAPLSNKVQRYILFWILVYKDHFSWHFSQEIKISQK